MMDRYQYEVIEIDNPYDVKLEKEAYDNFLQSKREIDSSKRIK